MDFIERFFGLSPDGGSGALELCFLAIPFLLLGLMALWTKASKKPGPRNE